MTMNPSSNIEVANVEFTSTTTSSGFDVETRFSRVSTMETNLFDGLSRNDATGLIGSTGMYTSNTSNATGTNQKSTVVIGTLVNDATKPTGANPFASNPREPNTQAGNSQFRTPGFIASLSLTTVGDFEVLIKDIDAGKHEELLSGMTDDKRKVVFEALGAMCDLIELKVLQICLMMVQYTVLMMLLLYLVCPSILLRKLMNLPRILKWVNMLCGQS
ncbi:hypothetical protein Tco_1158274 [Tanacetum coccineum]